MFLYIFVIGITMILVFAGNYFFFPAGMSLLKTSLLTLMLPFLMVAWDGIFATFIRRCLPEKWFTKDVKFHKVGKKECRIYEFFGIKLWKDHVLELGMFTSFSKKKVSEPDNTEYIERFILECNYGAVIHIWCAILGFIPIFFFPASTQIGLRFVLYAAIANAVLNILPLMILRYNIPRLTRLHAILEKKAARKANLQNQTNQTNCQIDS